MNTTACAIAVVAADLHKTDYERASLQGSPPVCPLLLAYLYLTELIPTYIETLLLSCLTSVATIPDLQSISEYTPART